MPKNCAAIVIAVKHSELIKVKDYTGVTNTVGALRCKFEFRTNDWDNASITAVFCKGNMATHPETIDNPKGIILEENNECAVPPEVLMPDSQYFSVGVWGVTDSGLRIVSDWLVFRIKDGCYVDSTAPIDPTPTVYEQILKTLQNKSDATHNHNHEYYTKSEIDSIYSSDKDLSNMVTKDELSVQFNNITQDIDSKDAKILANAKSYIDNILNKTNDGTNLLDAGSIAEGS